MAARTGQNFEMWQGDVVTVSVEIEGLDQPLSEYDVHWAMMGRHGAEPLVFKATGGEGITTDGQTAQVLLVRADTVDKTPGRYHHEVRVLGGDAEGKVVTQGVVLLRESTLGTWEPENG